MVREEQGHLYRHFEYHYYYYLLQPFAPIYGKNPKCSPLITIILTKLAITLK
jgi:hypothetical protein